MCIFIIYLLCSEIVDPRQGRHSILEDGTLMIQNAQDDDMGTYECIARNDAGEAKTDTVQLRMRKPLQGNKLITEPDLRISTIQHFCYAFSTLCSLV